MNPCGPVDEAGETNDGSFQTGGERSAPLRFSSMDCRLTVVTLAVTSLDRSRRFYCDGLRWPPATGSDENIVFFAAGGVVLALY
jgi:hypothetical protein